MFSLHIASPQGVRAQFDVDSAVLALDLALRAKRLGFACRAETRGQEPALRLSVDQLRQLAVTAAAGDDAERHLLDQIEWQDQLLGSPHLN